ncbi:MAG: HAD family phosphatase [Altererythrobacter sp.]
MVFDVGRVIVRWDMRILFAKLFDDPLELDWFCTNVVTEAWHGQHDAGRPIGEMAAERIAAFPEYRAAIEAYRDRWLETIPGVVSGVPELIERLAARDMPLFAITNFGTDFWAHFRPTQPVLDHFRDIVVSGHERLVKPGSAIFRLAAARFGHAPERMLFIDDSLPNIEAAARLGWHAHHFTDAATLEADLARYGLL